MSVRMTVELLVSGTDDAEAVKDALLARDRYYWPEIGAPVWAALQDFGIDALDVSTENIDCERVGGRAP